MKNFNFLKIILLVICTIFTQNVFVYAEEEFPWILFYPAFIHKPVSFVSSPTFAPDTIYDGESTEIIVAITTVEATANQELKLLRCNENGTILSQVANLYDNGDLNIGDDIKGDGVFHGKFSVTSGDDADLFYRVQKSAVTRLAVVPEILDSRLNEISNEATTAGQTYDDVIDSGGSATQAQAALQIHLTTLQNIAQQGVSEEGFGSWWVTAEGVLCIHDPLEDSTDVKSSPGVQRNSDPFLPERIQELTKPILPHNYPAPTLYNSMLSMSLPASDDDNYIGSKEALILDVYYFTDENPYIEMTLGNLCMNVTRVLEGNVTLEHFKNLDKYGTFCVSSHGNSYYKGLWNL